MLVVTQIWYPGLLFSLENVWQGLQILLPVDAILGPLLTLILFVPGKKGLVGDLMVVGTLQVLALVAGGYIIYQQRPEIMVFAGDRFEIIPASKFDRENFAAQYFKDSELSYPQLVYALPGQTPEEKSSFVFNNVQYQKMSERYRPLKEFQKVISEKNLNPSYLAPVNATSKQVLDSFNIKFKDQEVMLFRLTATTTEAAILILDKNTLENLGYLNIDPWKEYKVGVEQLTSQ